MAAKRRKKAGKNSKKIKVESPFTPHKHQAEMWEGWKRFNVAITCRGWGKTVFAVMSLDAACRGSKKPQDFGYICPVKAQAWDVISPVIYQFLGHLEAIDDGNGGIIKAITIKDSAMEVHYTNGCKFKAYGADHPNNKVIRGKTFGGVVIDEFDDTDFNVWLEIISPCLRGGGWALFTGTVKPGSNLYRLMDEYMGHKDWNIGVYKFEDCWEDLPAYDQEQYDEIQVRFKNNPNKYAREYQCDPTASDDDVVIPTDLIHDATGKHIPKEAYEGLAKVLGVDVATGHGADKSAICKRQGLYCHKIEEYNLDNMALVDQIIYTIKKWENEDGVPVAAIFVDKGRGEGVISRMQQLGYRPIGVDFGGTPAKDIYRNKRTEMYHDGVKNWLAMGGALPDDKKLVQELAVPVLKPGDKFLMERKEDIKKKLGRSPDEADALALTFAAPVVSRHKSTDSRMQSVRSTGYSPLNERFNQKRREIGYGIFR